MANGNMGGLYMELSLKDKVQTSLLQIEKSFEKLQASGNATERVYKDIEVAIKGLTGSGQEAAAAMQAVKSAAMQASSSMESMTKGTASFKAMNEYAVALSRAFTVLREKADPLSGLKFGVDGGSLRSFAALSVDASYSMQKLERDITNTEARMKELGDAMNKIMALGPEKTGQLGALKQLQGEYYGLKAYVEQLYLQLVNADRGMQGFSNSLVKGSVSAKEHEQRQRELSNTFQRYFSIQDQAAAAEQRSAEAVAKNNAVRREAVAILRQQSEALVSSRISLLEGQQRQLGTLYKDGKGTMSVSEIEQVRSAYAAVSRELMELRTVLQDIHSYSSRQLFSFGRGATNFAPLIGSTQASLARAVEIARLSSRAQSDLAKAFKDASHHAGQLSGTMQDLKSLFLQGGLVYGAQQFAMSIITVGGEMERQHIALQSILGDVQNANTMFGQIKQLALESPFTFSELNKDVKQLAAYGVEYDELYDTTKRLADMSSGLGVSFERIALAFGQVRARGFLDGKELRQISYAGIPLLAKLSELYSKREGKSVTTSQVKKRISNREVSFEDVKGIFWEMTDAGGQFYNMQQTLSETLLGRYNKLKDAWEIMLSEFASGKSIVGSTFSSILDGITAIVQGMNSLGPVVAAAFSGFALRKIMMGVGGNLATGFLSGKASLAAGYQQRVLQGEQLSQVEARILATKSRITAEDVRNLALQKAITKAELERLYVSGRISSQAFGGAIGKVASAGNMSTMRDVVALRQQGGMFNSMRANFKMMGLQTSTYFATLKANLATSGVWWKSFAARGLSAMSLVGTGIKSLGSSMFAMVGGLPGLMLTAVAMIGMHLFNESQKWKQAMEQTAEELRARFSSVSDFLQQTNVAEVLSRGNEKEINNTIEAYKDKIKEIAAYDFQGIAMKSEERKSAEERLKYLDETIKKIMEANRLVDLRLSDKELYKSFSKSFELAGESSRDIRTSGANLETLRGELESRYVGWLKKTFHGAATDPATIAIAQDLANEVLLHAGDFDTSQLQKIVGDKLREAYKFDNNGTAYINGQVHYSNLSYAYSSDFLNNAYSDDVRKQIFTYKKGLEDYKKAKDEIEKEMRKAFPGLNIDASTKDAGQLSLRESDIAQAKVTMDTMMASLSTIYSEDQIKALRGSLEVALGIGDDTIRTEFASSVSDMISQTFPDISNKIRSGKELDEATKEKVRKLMGTASDELKTKYPDWASTLQTLLDESQFQATISLVYDLQKPMGELEKQIYDNYFTGVNPLHYDENYNKYLKPYVQGKESAYEIRNAIKGAIDNAYNEKLARKSMLDAGKITQEDYDSSVQEYNNLVDAAMTGLGYDYEGEKNKSNKDKSNTNKTDAELKSWRERVNAAKSFYQEYKKYRDVIGPDRAMEQVRDLYPDVEDMDVTDYVGSLQKIIDKLGDGWFGKSAERKQFLTSIKKEIKDWNLTEVFKREAEEASAAFTEALEKGISQFDLYKSLFEKTGRKDFASQAFVDGAIWNDNTRGLAAQFKELTGEDIDIDATDTQAEHHLENIAGAYDLWKKIVELVKGDYKSSLEESAEIMSKHATIAEQLASIDARYDKIVSEAWARNDGTAPYVVRRAERSRRQEKTDAVYGSFAELKPLSERIYDVSEKYAELIEYAQKSGDEELLSKATKSRNAMENDERWKDMNKQTDLEGMMSNVEHLTNATITKLAAEITKWLSNEDLSGELADKLIGFQGKVSEYQASRGNILAGLQGLSQSRNIRRYMKGKLGSMATRVDASGVTRYVLSEEQAKKTGLTAGGVGYTKSQLVQAGIEDNGQFNASVSTLSDKFKALQDCLSPVIDLFETLGMEDTAVGVVASTASNALGAASSVAGGLSSLGLSSLGPYGAAAAAALSVTSSLLALHDKQLQKEIDASKERQKVEEYLYENIKSTVDDLLGGVYSFNLDGEMKKTLEDIVAYQKFTIDSDDALAKMINESFNAIYSDDTYTAAKRALSETGNAYQGELAALMAQRDEIKNQYELEGKKKDSDSTALIEYKQQLYEAEQAVSDFADTFAEEIYGIDIKSWASELTDAVIEAWAAGEDAAEAYGDKVHDIMKSLTKSILSQMFMETALEPVKDYYTEQLQKKGKLEESDITKMSDLIYDAETGAVSDIIGVLDELKSRGLDLSEDSSSSVSSSIKGVTEETADLLASYINGIRLDVSVNRENVRLIAAAVTGLPHLSTIAQSQLTQLTMLVTLANARNAKMDDMYDWMRSVTTGTKKIYIS